MKTLEYTFVSNQDQMGNMNFKQVRREGDVAMYERSWPNGDFHSYEVFIVQSVKAGAKLPNGASVKETYERYPTKNAFGKTAYAIVAKVNADERFEELKEDVKYKKENPGTRRGRKSKATAEVIVPSGSFTMFDLTEKNFKNGWTKPRLYLKLQELIKDGTVKCIGDQPNVRRRGKPAKVYVKLKH